MATLIAEVVAILTRTIEDPPMDTATNFALMWYKYC